MLSLFSAFYKHFGFNEYNKDKNLAYMKKNLKRGENKWKKK